MHPFAALHDDLDRAIGRTRATAQNLVRVLPPRCDDRPLLSVFAWSDHDTCDARILRRDPPLSGHQRLACEPASQRFQESAAHLHACVRALATAVQALPIFATPSAHLPNILLTGSKWGQSSACTQRLDLIIAVDDKDLNEHNLLVPSRVFRFPAKVTYTPTLARTFTSCLAGLREGDAVFSHPNTPAPDLPLWKIRLKTQTDGSCRVHARSAHAALALATATMHPTLALEDPASIIIEQIVPNVAAIHADLFAASHPLNG